MFSSCNSFSIWWSSTEPPPLVIWCFLMMPSMEWSHCLERVRFAMPRSAPDWLVMWAGSPPMLISALMYGPGRAMT